MPGGSVHQTPCGLAWRDQWGSLRYAGIFQREWEPSKQCLINWLLTYVLSRIFFIILGNFLEHFFEFRHFNLAHVNLIMYPCYTCCYPRKYNVNQPLCWQLTPPSLLWPRPRTALVGTSLRVGLWVRSTISWGITGTIWATRSGSEVTTPDSPTTEEGIKLTWAH